MPEDLPADYYLNNFTCLIDFVVTRYGAILNDDEARFASDFQDLTPDAQRLYVRLCSRKGPLFRSDKLQYTDITDVESATVELAVNRFTDAGDDSCPGELLSLLTRSELITRLPDRSTAGLKKPDILTLAAENISDVRAILPFTVIRPCRLMVLRVYRLLFFGNLHQDMTEFVLHELGVIPFESYEIKTDARLFSDRRVLDETIALYDLGESAREIIDSGDERRLVELLSQLPARNSNVRRLGHRYDRIVNGLARHLERCGLLDKALVLFDSSMRPPARERMARILFKLDEPESAITVCEDIMGQPWDEAEYEFAAKFLRRLLEKRDLRRRSLPDLKLKTAAKKLSLHSQPDCRVEQLVCNHARAEGYDAHYVENALFNGLFGLSFWDIIFASVPEAFFNPFQRGPADLFQPTFLSAREACVENRFRLLAQPGQLYEIVSRHFEDKYGLANHFVQWARLTPELLDTAIANMPIHHLLSVFRRMLADLRNNRSGFPDLVLFHDETYELVEVKGPGDRLQINQTRWLRFFNSKDIPASVANVSYL